MPTDRNTETSRPEALHTISDADKAAAISAVYKRLTGQAVDVRIEMIDYNGRYDPRGPYRHYAAMRFALFAKVEDASAAKLVESLQQVDDRKLADAIASQLGRLAGESYQGYIAMKRTNSRPKKDAPIADIRIQLATA